MKRYEFLVKAEVRGVEKVVGCKLRLDKQALGTFTVGDTEALDGVGGALFSK